MPLEMYFNELSTKVKAPTKEDARDIVNTFMKTILEAASRGVKRMLHIPEDFDSTPLANGYYWKDWRQDKQVDRDLKLYFKDILNKVYLIEELDYNLTDCFFVDDKVIGLKAAYLNDGLAVSLLSEDRWNCDLCEVEIQEIIAEDISCLKESVHHASTQEHIIKHTNWIETCLKEEFNSGKELWELINSQLTHLIFCRDVEEQVCKLPQILLQPAFRCLFALNKYCVEINDGQFDPKEIGCIVTPESSKTLNQFGDERTFLCPNNQSQLFNWHAKKGGVRVYFDYEYKPGYILIGYVGKHLRTAKFK